MKDVFAYIRQTATREYLIRCSYLEIYNETYTLFSLLRLSTTSHLVDIHGKGLSVLREEVVKILKGVTEVLARGNANRRTAAPNWPGNERSSRSHSVFGLVIESRERREGVNASESSGRSTPGPPGPPTLVDRHCRL